MQIIVTKKIGVEADTIEAGIAAVANGEGSTISMSADPRPTGQIGQGIVTGSSFQSSKAQPTPTLTSKSNA